MGLLLEFAFTVLGGAVLGYMLDEKFGTKPWITVGLLALAFVANIKIMWVIYKKTKETMEER